MSAGVRITTLVQSLLKMHEEHGDIEVQISFAGVTASIASCVAFNEQGDEPALVVLMDSLSSSLVEEALERKAHTAAEKALAKAAKS